MREERKRVAAKMLHRAGVFPRSGHRCLEVGYGSLGWLGDLITWGIPETSLHGIELDAARACEAQRALPSADLRVGDATSMPWDSSFFDLVVVSTVFTSILDPQVRRSVAAEIIRVTRPGGAVLWYDFAVNNPRNQSVRKVGRKELTLFFPHFKQHIKSVTLAPPLARLLAKRSWTIATLLAAVPLVRTHLLAVLIKPQ